LKELSDKVLENNIVVSEINGIKCCSVESGSMATPVENFPEYINT